MRAFSNFALIRRWASLSNPTLCFSGEGRVRRRVQLEDLWLYDLITSQKSDGLDIPVLPIVESRNGSGYSTIAPNDLVVGDLLEVNVNFDIRVQRCSPLYPNTSVFLGFTKVTRIRRRDDLIAVRIIAILRDRVCRPLTP